MKIRLMDGRVFGGTALEIVRGMQALAFAAQDLPVAGYCDWVADNTRRFHGLELHLTGDTDEARAASLVRELLQTGLAEPVDDERTLR